MLEFVILQLDIFKSEAGKRKCFVMISFCTEEPGAGRKIFEFEGWRGKETNIRPVFSELIQKRLYWLVSFLVVPHLCSSVI